MSSSTVGAAIGRPPKEPAAGMWSICIVVALLLAGILLWSVLSIHAITSDQTMQYEAERWQGPSEQIYAQVSVFLKEGEMDASRAEALSYDLRAAFPTEEIPPFVTAYGARSAGLAVYGHRSTEAELWNVSKDFFALHAFPTAAGGTGTFADTGGEAVLNEAAAFALFGSVHACGEALVIGGSGFRVIAVLREPQGSANAAAWGDQPRIWLPLEEGAGVTFFEAVLPEYYAGFSEQTLSGLLGRTVTENTGRFRLPALWARLKAFFAAPPQALPQLPPWEQAARLAERRLCAFWTVLLPAASLLLGLLLHRCLSFLVRRITRPV